ncbi:uncharacterized protein [Fopius arisanus]|uniref:Uncharacterized protein n=1 Tax=Fopius arisanus TaxID=64838 RepID=A0A9R1TUW6_9HYME|nr:PREDICTED: uncharacterized protein LOC105274252 [Fopius arisanus]
MKIVIRMFLMEIIMLSSSCGLPIYEMQSYHSSSDVKDSEFMPMITSSCTSNGGCWGWLSTGRNRTNGPQKLNAHRRHDNFNISTFQQNSETEADAPLKSPIVKGVVEDARSMLSVLRRIPSNKPVKKDAFNARSWGAGGMPFSVLYMNPHGTRMSHPTPDTPKKPSELPKKLADVHATTSKQQNNRVTVRNGTSSTRRQYSIIPQLFISYGWGPFGK